ncbi:MAG: ketoacyl-ACP synthase III [Verrucomicrobiae bacterium]|nr:ketoacyl-ACP synthase III [Verrucomicrobiae bacterium]
MGRPVSIVGTGSFLPRRVLTNADLEKIVDTSDEWITTRTGIKERRIAQPNKATSDMAAEAALKALQDAKIGAEEVDLLICATITPDMPFPSTACFIQKKIGAHNAACFDIGAACSGFLYALKVAKQFIATGAAETVLVIGAEKLSSAVDWTDRNTCVLFGDAAGAAVLRSVPGRRGVIATEMGSDGRQTDILCLPGGGSKHPITAENIVDKLHTIKMAGKETYKFAVTVMQSAALKLLKKAGVDSSEIALVIPHQANLRIIESLADKLDLPREKFFVNLDKYGNTSAASVAVALDEASKSGRLKSGDLVLLVAFGAGLTWAATILEW